MLILRGKPCLGEESVVPRENGGKFPSRNRCVLSPRLDGRLFNAKNISTARGKEAHGKRKFIA